MKKIFIIEDDDKIREGLKIFLTKYGYDVDFSCDFENIVEETLKYNPNLILLDINLPFYDGYYICREIRKTSNVPIIVVTSRDSEMDELMSMNLGADDFVTKPYNTQILLARISSVLRRASNLGVTDVLEYKDILFDMSKSKASFKENSCDLTKNESKILNLLITKKETIISRNEIMKMLWESDEFIDDNTLTVNVNRLRRKLTEIGAVDYLKTKRGQGYILICE